MPERQHRLSLGSYGRPRMTEELNELGLRVGQPLPGNGLHANRERGRVGRVRQENDPPDRFQNLSHCARTAFRSFERGSSSAPPAVARQAIAKQSAERGRSAVQHRAESLAARLHGERAEPKCPFMVLHANHCRVTGRRHHLCLDARSMSRARKRSGGSFSRRLGSIWLSSLIFSQGAWWDGLSAVG